MIPRSILLLVLSAVSPTTTTVGRNGGPQPAGEIIVEREVRISGDASHNDFADVVVCAHPHLSGRLVAAGMRSWLSADRKIVQSSMLFTSSDGGGTWTRTLDTRDFPAGTPDPACAFGPGGEAYLTTMSVADGLGPILFYSSPDGGQTWGAAMHIGERQLDRQWIVADHTAGPYHGRVYIGAFLNAPSDRKREFVLFRSASGGTDFERVSQISQYMHNGPMVVLSDGKLVGIRAHTTRREQEPADAPPPEGGWLKGPSIVVGGSRDGGASLSAPTVVAPLNPATQNKRFLLTDFIPGLAADVKTTAFHDRLYATWVDAGSGRLAVMVAHSEDGGLSWSQAIAVSDDASARNGPDGPDHVNPSIAVNGHGVVAVLWYDRRDNPDFGYWPRMSASLDGGETWLRSRRISTHPHIARLDGAIGLSSTLAVRADTTHELAVTVHNGWNFKSGDTSGLTADADGTFHPVWIDNRTGKAQMWTASVRVAGQVRMLRDVSSLVTFDAGQVGFDAEKRVVWMSFAVVNSSSDTLRGPLTLQVRSVRSGIAKPELLGASNGWDGAGATYLVGRPGSVLPRGERLEGRIEAHMPKWRQAAINPLSIEFRVLAPSGGASREAAPTR
jgi:hypothetical protein